MCADNVFHCELVHNNSDGTQQFRCADASSATHAALAQVWWLRGDWYGMIGCRIIIRV